MGFWTTSGLKTDGTLWMWGNNGYGQLGNGITVSNSSPVQIAGTTWKQAASLGTVHSASIKTDGTLWTWGNNDEGQLGSGAVSNRSSPVQTIAGGTNWKMVTCGFYHNVAIKTDGTLWAWGRNTNGQLGDSTTTQRNSPVQIVGTNWKMVSCGRYHTSAVKTDGTLWTWGRNTSGQLGDGTTADKSSPVQITGNNWKKVSAGGTHTFGIYFYDAGNLYP